MSDSDITERVFDIFKEQFYDVEALDDLSLGTPLSVFNADSLDTVEVTCSLEAEFDIDIDDELVPQWQTIEDCVGYVSSKVKLGEFR